MRFHKGALVSALLFSCPGLTESSEKQKAEPWKPCTVRSSSSGNFFDINALQATGKVKKDTDKLKDTKPTSWHSRGYDYGSNFTLNFCGGVVEDLKEMGGAEDISPKAYQNVSAYYRKGDKLYSIG